MKSPGTQKGFVDTLRLSETELHTLLKDMDERDRESDVGLADLRSSQRLHYSVSTPIVLHIVQEDLSDTHFLAHPRNISSGGMAFLHGSYLHAGTRCRFAMKALDGGINAIQGEVVHCRHVKDRVHEVGFRFDSEIDPNAFVDHAAMVANEADAAGAPATVIFGHAIVIEMSVDQRPLLSFELGRYGLWVETYEEVAQGMDALGPGVSILLICKRSVDAMGGMVISGLRRKGYEGPVVLIGDDEGVIDIDDFAGTLKRPIGNDAIQSMLKEHLVTPSVDSEALLSDRWTESNFRGHIWRYLESLSSRVDQLNGLMEAGDLSEFELVCNEVAASAVGYGYRKISKTATELAQSLQSEQQDQLEDQFKELEELTRQACRLRKDLCD